MTSGASMSYPSRHLCIATGQNSVNLIPALQLQATEVLILETPAMREAAKNLQRALEKHGIEIHRLPFDDSTPAAIEESAAQIALNLGEEPLVFNATGGHKLMVLALTENLAALADGLSLVYAETRHDRLDWLKPKPSEEPMQSVLDIDDILNAQGYRRVTDKNRDGFWQAEIEKRAQLTREMGDRAERYERFFGLLNKLADLALNDGNVFRAKQEFDYTPGGDFADLLKQAQDFHLLVWNGEEIVFSSKEAAAYFRGGWLEEYVWFKLKGLAQATSQPDWAVNLKMASFATQTENEFDAVVVCRNRLLAIECKTSGFGKNQLKDVGYIYKLKQLAEQVGGSMSSKLLLSARTIPEDIKLRARDYGVDVLEAAQVKNLVDYLKKWMQST
jgi:hypothetical protein